MTIVQTSSRDHLFQLIRIPSPSFVSNREVIEYAKRVLYGAGWAAREVVYYDQSGVEKVNLIAAPPQQDCASRSAGLTFVCHTDTVPFSPMWAEALQPTIKHGYLHGCGACDVKGFLACLLEAATSQQGRRWAEGLRIVLTADEEVGCLGAKHLISQDVLRSRRMIIGEPTSLCVARAGKGYCLAEVILQGREAHSAFPEQGVSAIYAAGRLIRSIESLAGELRSQWHPLFAPPFTTVNIGTIQGGSAKNIVPGECRFMVEWRPIPSAPASQVPDALEAMAKALRAEDARMKVTLQYHRDQEGFETPEDAALVQTLQSGTGRPATSIPFGSEASLFASQAEETVVFGPGDMRTAHSERECVPLAELDQAVGMFYRLMTNQE